MRKISHFLLAKIIPALILIIFSIIMNSGTVFKNFFGLSGNLPEYINILQVSINNSNWSEAVHYLKEIESGWHKLLPRLQYSVERDEINNFQHSLARLKGFINAREKAGALAESSQLKETWNDLGK